MGSPSPAPDESGGKNEGIGDKSEASTTNLPHHKEQAKGLLATDSASGDTVLRYLSSVDGTKMTLSPQQVQNKTLNLSTVVDSVRFMRDLVPFPDSLDLQQKVSKRKETGGDKFFSNDSNTPLQDGDSAATGDRSRTKFHNRTGGIGDTGKDEKVLNSSTTQGVPSMSSLVSHIEEVPTLKKDGKRSPDPSPPKSDSRPGMSSKEKVSETKEKTKISHIRQESSHKVSIKTQKVDDKGEGGAEKKGFQVETKVGRSGAGGAQSSLSSLANDFENENKADTSKTKVEKEVTDDKESNTFLEGSGTPRDRKKSSKGHERDEEDEQSTSNHHTEHTEPKKKKHKDRESRLLTKKSKRKNQDMEKNPGDAIPVVPEVPSNNNDQDEAKVHVSDRNTESTKQIEFGSLTGNTLLQGMNAKLMNEELFAMGSYSTTGKEVSFLESMSEEERRTRNRHIPEVKGFRRLHRQEIKRDIKVLKTRDHLPWLAADGGLSADLAAASEGFVDGEDPGTDMEIEKDSSLTAVFDTLTASDENPFVSRTYCDAANTRNTDEGGDASDQNDEANTSHENGTINVRYPNQVQNVLAFDPPRDDVMQQGIETYIQRKKHRIASLEQHPYDIGLSLKKFQSTVRETRFEWQNAELELERVEGVGATLRNHLLQQAKALRDENIIVSQQVASRQRQCLAEADTSTGRSRRRDHSNGHTMLDVLSVLKNRGEKLSSVLPQIGSHNESEQKSLTNSRANSSFIVPGDTVITAFGTGTVIDIEEASISPSTNTLLDEDRHLVSQPRKAVVQLKFGVAHLSCKDLRPMSNNNGGASLPDAALVKRWKDILKKVESGTCSESHEDIINLPANDGYTQPPNDAAPFSRTLLQAVIEADRKDKEKAKELELRDTKKTSDSNNGQNLSEGVALNCRTIPFKGGLLPTGGEGSEDALADYDLIKIQAELDRVTHNCSRHVLGREDNHTIPPHIRQWEKERHELYKLKAEVLRLQNRLLHQKRARAISERAYVNAEEKNDRALVLVDEMKADLNLLKKRLSNELMSIGIDEEQSRQILLDHFASQESWAHDHSLGERRLNRGGKFQNLNGGLYRGEVIAAVRSSRRRNQQGVGMEGFDLNYTQEGQDLDSESVTSASRRTKRTRSNQGTGGFDESTSRQRQAFRQ